MQRARALQQETDMSSCRWQRRCHVVRNAPIRDHTESLPYSEVRVDSETKEAGVGYWTHRAAKASKANELVSTKTVSLAYKSLLVYQHRLFNQRCHNEQSLPGHS